MRAAHLIRRLAVVVTLAGCHATPLPPASSPRQLVALPEVPRAVAAPDVTQVAAKLPADADDSGPYLALAAEECRRLAAVESSIARRIEEAARPRPQVRREPTAAEQFRVALAAVLADEARNRTAGAALEGYYRLLEAELVSDALGRAIVELDALNANLDALAASGIAEPADAPSLRARRLSARADRETARRGARRLSAELLATIGSDARAGRVNPTDQVVVPPEDLDPEPLVALALQSRADVRAARLVESQVTPETAPVIRSTLDGLTPGLPELPGGFVARLLLLCQSPTDVVARAQSLRHDREQAAASTVRASVTDYNSARAAVGAAKVRLAQETRRVTSTQGGADAGLSGAEVPLRLARLATIEAEADLLRAAIRWKLADIALRQELGILGVVK